MNLAKLGEFAGLAAGVTVTAGLRFSRKWNAPLVQDGQPVERITGAERIGEHELKQRHQEVVGPLISARAEQMPTGALQSLVAGFAAGATEAPGTTYRLEAKLEDYLKTVANRQRA